MAFRTGFDGPKGRVRFQGHPSDWQQPSQFGIGGRPRPGRSPIPHISGTRAVQIAQNGGPARKLARALGKRVPFIYVGKQIYDAIHQQQGTDLPSPARIRNGMWESSPCTGPETVCELGSQPQWYASSVAFCWNPNPPFFQDNVAPGAIPHGFKYFWRCDLRGTEYEWYGAGWLWSRLAPWSDVQYGRDWPWSYIGPLTRGPHVHPDILPEAQPIDQPQPHPAKRPYWARPVRLPGAVTGREEGYAAPQPQPQPTPPGGGVTYPPHILVPPGRGVKERKVKTGGVLGQLLARIMIVTELRDAAREVAEGLGFNDKIRVCKVMNNGGLFCYEKRLHDKNMSYLQFIYQHWDKATPQQLQKAIENLLLNEIQDQAIGRLRYWVNGRDRIAGLKTLKLWGGKPTVVKP